MSFCVKSKEKSPLSQTLSRLLLKWTGWKAVGDVPAFPKYIMLGYPHTSNWDLPIGYLVFSVLGVRVHWIGKHTLFRGPLGWLMRRMGGIPVDRTRRQKLVEQIADCFRKSERLVIAISPEGTRKKTEFLRTGFYHMARTAGIPIALAYLDYHRRQGGFLAAIIPSGNIEDDLKKIASYYSAEFARYPERAGRFALPPQNSK